MGPKKNRNLGINGDFPFGHESIKYSKSILYISISIIYTVT